MPPPDRSLSRVSAALREQWKVTGEAETQRSAAELASWQPTRDRPISLARYLERRGPSGALAAPVNSPPPDPEQNLAGWQQAASIGVGDGVGALRPADAGRVVLLDLVNRRLRDHEPIAPAAVTEAARALASIIQDRFAGKTLEVRIPPVTAVQLTALGSGPQHHRGTPPNVLEMDAATWVRLAMGHEEWSQVRPQVSASGAHVDDIAAMLPIYPTESAT